MPRNRNEMLMVVGLAAALLGPGCTRDRSDGRPAGLPPSPATAVPATIGNERASPPAPVALAPPTVVAPSSAQREALARALGVHTSAPDPAGTEPVPEAFDEKEVISGTIVLPAANKGKVARGDTIFLAARRAGGPPGPGSMLAAQKLSAEDFPMRFVLSGRDAMIPGVPFEGRMSITVRVDKDGDAMTRRKGDVYGQANNVMPGTNNVVVSLDFVQTEDKTLGEGSTSMGGPLPPGHP